MFDRANKKTKMENARAAKLWDVLIYASEKKGYEQAVNAMYERTKPKK